MSPFESSDQDVGIWGLIPGALVISFHLPPFTFHEYLLLTMQSYEIFHREICLLMPFNAF